jgi:hypothetical protein
MLAHHNASHHTNSALTSCPRLAMVSKMPRTNSGAVPKLDPLKSSADAVTRKADDLTTTISRDDRIVTKPRRGRNRNPVGFAGIYVTHRHNRCEYAISQCGVGALGHLEKHIIVRQVGREISYRHNETSAAKVLIGMERPVV